MTATGFDPVKQIYFYICPMIFHNCLSRAASLSLWILVSFSPQLTCSITDWELCGCLTYKHECVSLCISCNTWNSVKNESYLVLNCYRSIQGLQLFIIEEQLLYSTLAALGVWLWSKRRVCLGSEKLWWAILFYFLIVYGLILKIKDRFTNTIHSTKDFEIHWWLIYSRMGRPCFLNLKLTISLKISSI